MALLSARRKDHQFNTLTRALLSYKLIFYKAHNKTNQSIFITIYPPTNTCSNSISTKETLAIVPPTSPTSPYLKTSNLHNVYTDVKSPTNKHHS